MSEEFYSGFDDFSELLKKYEKQMSEENILKVLEVGAKSFVKDVKALPKPRSQMTAPGYTHLLDTISYKMVKNEIETGWGKYYGPMVENGTKRMTGVPHMKQTFERNKERYYKDMQNELFR